MIDKKILIDRLNKIECEIAFLLGALEYNNDFSISESKSVDNAKVYNFSEYFVLPSMKKNKLK